MLTFELNEDDRSVKVSTEREDMSWEEVVENVIIFLHACGYVFERDEVVGHMEELKEEVQEAEKATEEGAPF